MAWKRRIGKLIHLPDPKGTNVETQAFFQVSWNTPGNPRTMPLESQQAANADEFSVSAG